MYRKHEQKRLYPIVVALRAEREAKKHPRKVIAYKMGYDEKTLAKWEWGTILPSLQALHDWCEVLGVEAGIHPRTE
jgi:transcriptional regulator with XRE-family HTH domain